MFVLGWRPRAGVSGSSSSSSSACNGFSNKFNKKSYHFVKFHAENIISVAICQARLHVPVYEPAGGQAPRGAAPRRPLHSVWWSFLFSLLTYFILRIFNLFYLAAVKFELKSSKNICCNLLRPPPLPVDTGPRSTLTGPTFTAKLQITTGKLQNVKIKNTNFRVESAIKFRPIFLFAFVFAGFNNNELLGTVELQFHHEWAPNGYE